MGAMTIPLALPLPTRSSWQPGVRAEAAHADPLFAIASGGACRAVLVAKSAVGSYPTVSPWPKWAACATCEGRLFSVALSLGLPRPGVTRHHCFV